MKLVDIVATRVKSWPYGVVCYTQDYNGTVWACGLPHPHFDSDGVWKCDGGLYGGYIDNKFTSVIADDYKTTKVTKEMWERAVADRFTISDIKNGMRVKLRRGTMYIKFDDSFRDLKGFTRVNEYTNDMLIKISDGEPNPCDIIEVYADIGYNLNPEKYGRLLWKRQELTPQQKQILELEEIIKNAQEKIQALKNGDK